MAKKKMTLEEKLEEAIVKDAPYEVPENWVWSRLENIVNFERGITFSASEKKSEKQQDDIACLRTANVQKRLEYDDLIYVNKKHMKSNDKKLVKTGDILMSTANSLELVGKSVLVPQLPEEMTFGGFILNIRNNSLMNNKFIYYYLNAQYLLGGLQGIASQTTNIANINAKNLGNYFITIPPLKEQQRIVDKIESLFEKLDKSKELIEEARDGFEKRKQSLREKAFRGELTKEWRRKNKCEKGELKKIGDIAQLISGQHIASSDYNDEGTGIGYLTGPSDFNKIYPSITKWTNKPKVIAMNNDILITVKGSGVGSINILNKDNICISRQLMAIRSNEINYYYIFWYLKYSYTRLQAMATGTAIPGLSRKDILELNIYCPKKDEEEQIVSILNKLFNNESKIEELTNLEEQIELIKKSILAKAFRGELGTNCEEDESALELLKEILNKDL